MTDTNDSAPIEARKEWDDGTPYVPTSSPLFAVFNGHYWDVSVGPKEYSQSVASCMANGVLRYGTDDAGVHAKLFAASPDLLSACNTAIRILDAAGLSDRIGYHEISRAITKAIGA